MSVLDHVSTRSVRVPAHTHLPIGAGHDAHFYSRVLAVNVQSEFEIFIAYPPDREGRVAQLIVRRGAVADIAAEVYRDGDLTLIQLFASPDGIASSYRATDFAAAAEAAILAVETSVTYSVTLRPGQATEQAADGLDSEELDLWLSSNGDDGDPFVYSWTPPGRDVSQTGDGAVTPDGPAYRLRS